MEIKIEKDVPLPPIHTATKWAFLREMEVGDSAFIPDTTTGGWRAGAKATTNKLDAQFVSRTEGDGIRIWRLK